MFTPKRSKKALRSLTAILQGRDYCFVGELAARFYGSETDLGTIELELPVLGLWDVAIDLMAAGAVLHFGPWQRENLMGRDYRAALRLHGQDIELIGWGTQEVLLEGSWVAGEEEARGGTLVETEEGEVRVLGREVLLGRLRKSGKKREVRNILKDQERGS